MGEEKVELNLIFVVNDAQRIQVDLSRRYWIVYRTGEPSFPGQLADREATDKFATEPGHAFSSTPFLFRKCCITVRYVFKGRPIFP